MSDWRDERDSVIDSRGMEWTRSVKLQVNATVLCVVQCDNDDNSEDDDDDANAANDDISS